MLNLKNYLFILFVLIAQALQAQSGAKTCGFQQVYDEVKNKPAYLESQQILNEALKQKFNAKSDTVIVIPVVVHVIYKNGQENISDAQIYSQLDVLNADFRMNNTDISIVRPQFSKADVKLEFCLAKTDTNGNYTPGITRTFTTEDDIGRSQRCFDIRPNWNPTEYLNIWVCDFGDNIAGQAFPPGSPANKEGVVIDYTNFGTIGSVLAPYDKGRTTTHEIGHWLNLLHIWGSNDLNPSCFNDDQVNDTPNQGNIYFGCPGNRVSCASDDMVNNFMGYVDDRCMVHFSAGQKSRMRTALINIRPGVISSTKGCINIGLEERNADLNLKLYPNPTRDEINIKTEASLENYQFTWLTSQGKPFSPAYTTQDKQIRFQLKNYPPGIYILRIIQGGKIELKKVILNN